MSGGTDRTIIIASFDLMMASRRASFTYDFLEKPPDEYLCPVTFEILKDPQQTNFCCGEHLSRVAADRLKHEGKPCPFCKKSPLRTTDDLFFKKLVLALMVRCSNKALGCKWVGELGKLDEHLQGGSVDGECQYVPVACPNECGIQVQRLSLDQHISERCVKRQFTGQYCNENVKDVRTLNEHGLQCQKYPLPHTQQKSEGKFNFAGCGVKTQRSKMQEHMDHSKDEHILALADNVKIVSQQLRIHSLALAQLAPHPIFIAPPPICMDDFEQKKRNYVTWYSPSFYSHLGGYKMCMSVYANGYGNGEGTHVGVVIFMMRGEFDDHLKWPFKGKFKVHLINQREGGEHVEWRSKIIINENELTSALQNENFSRVLEGERAANGLGTDKFISHSDLYRPGEGKEYLKNDTLEFKFSITELKS